MSIRARSLVQLAAIPEKEGALTFCQITQKYLIDNGTGDIGLGHSNEVE